MADLASAGIAAMMTGATSLFNYNREAFIFERSLKQNMIHQEQSMRIQEAALYREDLRDLFDIVIKKMDSYLVINTLMLGFSISLFNLAAVPSGVPRWIFWLYVICLCGSILFLLLSVWLALYASVLAQGYQVRLLTQWMRLPVPSRREIEKAASSIGDYERLGASKFLRLPVLNRASELTDSDSSREDSFDGRGRMASGAVMGRELNVTKQIHFKLYSELQGYWQGYDAYARVAMVQGTNQLLSALGHLSLAYFIANFGQIWASLLFVLCIHYCEYLHMQMNLTLDDTSRILMPILVFGAPALTAVSSVWWHFGTKIDREFGIQDIDEPNGPKLLSVLAFFAHLAWVSFSVMQGFQQSSGLPIRFTTVALTNDIIGDGVLRNSIDKMLSRLGRSVKDVALPCVTEETPEDKCIKIEKKIQRLFMRWKAPGDQDKQVFLRAKFEKLQRYLKSLSKDDDFGSFVGSISNIDRQHSGISHASSKSQRGIGNEIWVPMKVTEATPGPTGAHQSQTYYLNASSGEIRISLPDDELSSFSNSEFLAAQSEGEKRLRLEIAEFARFIGKVQERTESSRIMRDATAFDLAKAAAKKNSAKYESNAKKTHDTQPWLIYKQASYLVIAIWALGCAWSVVHSGSDIMTGEMKNIIADRIGRGETALPASIPFNSATCQDIEVDLNGMFPSSLRFLGANDMMLFDGSYSKRGSHVTTHQNILRLVDNDFGISHGNLFARLDGAALAQNAPFSNMRLVSAASSGRNLYGADESNIYEATESRVIAKTNAGITDLAVIGSDLFILTSRNSIEKWDLNGNFKWEMRVCDPSVQWKSISGYNGQLAILGFDPLKRRTLLRRIATNQLRP